MANSGWDRAAVARDLEAGSEGRAVNLPNMADEVEAAGSRCCGTIDESIELRHDSFPLVRFPRRTPVFSARVPQ